MRKIKIGNASGYWGDDPDALYRQVTGGELDYVTMDFLAEVTMSIMQKQKKRNPCLGYATDFITMLKPALPTIMERKIRVITNAGGVSPFACAQAIATMAEDIGLKPRIAIVHGDDILAQVADLHAGGVSFINMEDHTSFDHIKDRLEAVNVYFGAKPVVDALHYQPDIVITGRVTDTGITLAPMIYEFDWQLDDWDRLASGVIAGHILECGSQVTGGNFTDWHLVKEFTPMGYPIVEMAEDATFTVTKHERSGGIVTIDTVREQLFYEMGDPTNYITPDVICDFTSLTLNQQGTDRVEVKNVKGRPATATYKVSMCYTDGCKSSGTIVICGPEATRKAQMFADIFWQRCPIDFEQKLTEYFGWNSCHRSLTPVPEGDEIMLRLSVRSDDRKKLKNFSKLLPALILSGPPGVTISGGAPKIQEIISYWPALLPKDAVCPLVSIYEEKELKKSKVLIPPALTIAPSCRTDVAFQVEKEQTGGTAAGRRVMLRDICLARSGDKGDAANIGVLTRNADIFAFLAEFLTAQRLKNYFRDFCLGKVTRYTLPNLCGFNFVLENALGGGGTRSLRIDPQGKTLAQALLRQEIYVPDAIIAAGLRSQMHAAEQRD